MNQPGSAREVERYLEAVRGRLRGMREPEVEEVLLELRGHVAERMESGMSAEESLRGLGDPVDLARMYRAERAVARAECARSPLTLVQGLLALRQESPAAWGAAALAAFGYAWAIAFAAAGIEKILSPRDVGLWHRPGTASLPWIMVDGPGPAGTRELLGWWFVPAALASFGVLLWLTNRFGRWWLRRWRTRQSRR